MKCKGVGRSKDEARMMAEDALKERLWRECWRSEIELLVKREAVVEIGGMYEVEIEI